MSDKSVESHGNLKSTNCQKSAGNPNEIRNYQKCGKIKSENHQCQKVRRNNSNQYSNLKKCGKFELKFAESQNVRGNLTWNLSSDKKCGEIKKFQNKNWN